MSEQHYKDMYENLKIQRNIGDRRIKDLEGALKAVDELRHRLKKVGFIKSLIGAELDKIARALRKPCMVLYEG